MAKIVQLLDEDELRTLKLSNQLEIIEELETFMKKHLDKNPPLELVKAFKEEAIVNLYGEGYLNELNNQDLVVEETEEIVEEVIETPTGFEFQAETENPYQETETSEDEALTEYLDEAETLPEVESLEDLTVGEVLEEELVEEKEEEVVDLASEFEMPGEASDEPLSEDEIVLLPEGERLINLEAAQRAKEEAEAARNDVSIPSVTDFLESENALPLQAPEVEQPLVSRRKPYKGLNEDLANLEDLH